MAAILMNNPDLDISEKTLYNYVNNSYFRGINNIDLLRKIKKIQTSKKNTKKTQKTPKIEKIVHMKILSHICKNILIPMLYKLTL